MLRFAGLVAAIIVYGSLFPFDFHRVGTPVDALNRLLHAWPERISFSDLIANVLLYVPLGFALAGAAVNRCGRVVAAAAAAILGALLSISMELTQYYLPSRATDLADVLWNALGVTLGGVVGALTGRRGGQAWRGHAPRIADPIAFLIAGAWIADRLWPFAPTLDVSHVRNALKPLLLSPRFVPVDVLRHGASWLAFATLLNAALPGRFSRALALAAMLAGPFASVAIAGRTITASAVLGAALAAIAWLVLSSRSPTSAARVLAILLIATILAVGLAPYELAQSPRRFDWIPFRSFVDSSILAASGAFLAKSFLFGAAVWAAARAGLGLVVGGAVTVLLLAVGWAQTYLPGRSAGVTDAAIALCMMLAIRFLRAAPRETTGRRSIAASYGEAAAATLPAATGGGN